jgi:phosphopantetheine--protein transferase-like protein
LQKRNECKFLKGVGVDLIRVRRIAQAYHRRPERFLHRIFSGQEIKLLFKKKNLLPSMAARFAAKEAVAKALGCGIGIARWREMEILPGKEENQRYVSAEARRAGLKSAVLKEWKCPCPMMAPMPLLRLLAYGD